MDTTGIFPLPNHRDGRQASVSDGFHSLADIAAGHAKRQHRGSDLMYRRTVKADPAKEHPYGSTWYEIPANYPTPALATHTGRVVLAENSVTGWWVVLDIGGAVGLAYHHLQNVVVRPGAFVGAGTPLGTVGGSPRPGDYGLWHLHFDRAEGCKFDIGRMARYNRMDGVFSDPEKTHLPGLRHVALPDGW